MYCLIFNIFVVTGIPSTVKLPVATVPSVCTGTGFTPAYHLFLVFRDTTGMVHCLSLRNNILIKIDTGNVAKRLAIAECDSMI